MPKPLEAFEDPDWHWSLLTSARDVDLEDQFFDRKEACAVDASGNVPKSQIGVLIEHLKATVSAFANENHEGGLRVLGISKTGRSQKLLLNLVIHAGSRFATASWATILDHGTSLRTPKCLQQESESQYSTHPLGHSLRRQLLREAVPHARLLRAQRQTHPWIGGGNHPTDKTDERSISEPLQVRPDRGP